MSTLIGLDSGTQLTEQAEAVLASNLKLKETSASSNSGCNSAYHHSPSHHESLNTLSILGAAITKVAETKEALVIYLN
ncbi:hypothetical protein MHYMCMPASI_00130 [Hyalomma marginatum]|uniref:Uncharacterized protein n=1 Tax=Hyalomma marginatum TaxID=34627 RepID=A0A8S4C3I6_9ACAR|nr:hypothetical protein MHYMCMPASI_00130 [Hyalomma marginatum]